MPRKRVQEAVAIQTRLSRVNIHTAHMADQGPPVPVPVRDVIVKRLEYSDDDTEIRNRKKRINKMRGDMKMAPAPFSKKSRKSTWLVAPVDSCQRNNLLNVELDCYPNSTDLKVFSKQNTSTGNAPKTLVPALLGRSSSDENTRRMDSPIEIVEQTNSKFVKQNFVEQTKTFNKNVDLIVEQNHPLFNNNENLFVEQTNILHTNSTKHV